MLVSRIQAEVYGQEWDPELVGVRFAVPEGIVIAETDEGVDMTIGDVLLASMSLILSLFEELVDETDVEAEELVGRMGVGVAAMAPPPDGSC